jgi:hypothetical protein
MKKFKHSGTLGDLIYSLPLVKHFGGGEFYLHLNQVDWIGRHYYGSSPDPFHRGRMTPEDLEFMRSFMESQPYITRFDALDSDTEITHNLDRFRTAFVNHPGNYVDIYSQTFGILDTRQQETLRNQPWLTVSDPVHVPDRPYVVNRTARWCPGDTGPVWAAWRAEGADRHSVFVGLESEYRAFCQATGWELPHYPTPTLLDLARVIAGAEQYIGNQSAGLALAIGLGVPYACESRRDLPLERNECYFPHRPNGEYF